MKQRRPESVLTKRSKSANSIHSPKRPYISTPSKS